VDGVEYLNTLIQILKQQNENIVLSGVNQVVQAKIEHEDFYQQKLSAGKIYARTSDAIDELYLNTKKKKGHTKKSPNFIPREV
jgi:hypothetical protein